MWKIHYIFLTYITFVLKSISIHCLVVIQIFTTDVILYHLEHLKSKGWRDVWVKIAYRRVYSLQDPELSFQDLLISFSTKYSNIIYHIPSTWNSNKNRKCNSKTKLCQMLNYSSIGNINYNQNYSENIRKLITSYNGYLFRQGLYGCPDNTGDDLKTANNEVFSSCAEFHEAEIFKWRTLLFIREFKYNATEDDVTFISQLSYSRIYILEQLSKLWDGPMSLTLYVTDSELYQSKTFIEKSEILKSRFNIAYHAIFKVGDNYPINELRNIALRQAVTPYVFLIDIDFLPMPALYVTIKKHIHSMQNMKKKVVNALIVPAFETESYLPQTKTQLLDMLDHKKIFAFHEKIFKPAHAQTDYLAWRIANKTYEVKWKKEYEPYVIVQKNVTEYDRRFFGYGWNKVSHIMELNEQNYQFLVLPDVFIVHRSHKFSHNRHTFLKVGEWRRCLIKLKLKFVRELKQKYQTTFQVKSRNN